MHAKPHTNGCTPDMFKAEGRRLHKGVTELERTVAECFSETLHMRNYQHLDSDLAEEMQHMDKERVALAVEALADLRAMAIELVGETA